MDIATIAILLLAISFSVLMFYTASKLSES